MDAENTAVFRGSLAVHGGEIARILKNSVEKKSNVQFFFYKEKQVKICSQSLSC